MFRKLIVVAAAIAMPVSIVAVSGGMAGASNPHTAAADSVSCKGITGTLSFSPKLDAAGYKSGKIATKGRGHAVRLHGHRIHSHHHHQRCCLRDDRRARRARPPSPRASAPASRGTASRSAT